MHHPTTGLALRKRLNYSSNVRRVRWFGPVALMIGWLLAAPLAHAAKSDYRMPQMQHPADNLPTAPRVSLGKTLFFDPRLSGSRWISCATCHNPTLGWSDGLPTALGNGMQGLPRATPTVVNTGFNSFQFWDGRARTLEAQALGPITSNGEMARNMDDLLAELQTIEGYRELFEAAYPGDGITADTLSKALAAYQRTLISPEAPFDRWVQGAEDAISDSAKRGFALFEDKARCSVCHTGFNFQDNGFHNIGVTQQEADLGRYNIRPVKVLYGAFKTPTLREISRTAPYMHNGIYDDLEAVIEHYDRGGDEHENLSPNMQPLNLTQDEKIDLLAFLQTLDSANPIPVTLPNLPQ